VLEEKTGVGEGEGEAAVAEVGVGLAAASPLLEPEAALSFSFVSSFVSMSPCDDDSPRPAFEVDSMIGGVDSFSSEAAVHSERLSTRPLPLVRRRVSSSSHPAAASITPPPHGNR